MRKQLLRTAIALAALTTLVAVVGADAAGTARGPSLTLRWQAPTPSDGTVFSVPAGEPLTLELARLQQKPGTEASDIAVGDVRSVV